MWWVDRIVVIHFMTFVCVLSNEGRSKLAYCEGSKMTGLGENNIWKTNAMWKMRIFVNTGPGLTKVDEGSLGWLIVELKYGGDYLPIAESGCGIGNSGIGQRTLGKLIAVVLPNCDRTSSRVRVVVLMLTRWTLSQTPRSANLNAIEDTF